jgi:hypothetical protein
MAGSGARTERMRHRGQGAVGVSVSRRRARLPARATRWLRVGASGGRGARASARTTPARAGPRRGTEAARTRRRLPRSARRRAGDGREAAVAAREGRWRVRPSSHQSPALGRDRSLVHDDPGRPPFRGAQALRPVLARAVSWGLIDSNPAKEGVDNPQRRRTEKRPFESWAELEALAAWLGTALWPARPVRCSHWVTPGRVDRARHWHIDRDARVVYVRRAYRNGPGQVAADGGEHSRRAIADDRVRRARAAAGERASPARR